jgi:hypothetical protein
MAEEKKKVATKEKRKKRKGVKDYKKEFLPPVDLKVDPDYPTNFPEMVVAGHKVTPKEADIFYTYHTTHNPALVCKKFDITRQTLWSMTKRSWWERWSLDQLKEWLDTTRNHYLSIGHKLVEQQSAFLDNPSKYPQGFGQALAKMMDTFLRASPEGLRPTLVSKFEHEFQANVKETVDIKINITSDHIKKLTPEQIEEWNLTGVIPQELAENSGDMTDIIGETVDVDFEEIEEEEDESD